VRQDGRDFTVEPRADDLALRMRGDRSVDVFVAHLRQKLARASPRWRYIHTHFGIGYRLEAEPDEPACSGERARASPVVTPRSAGGGEADGSPNRRVRVRV
jgi:hypothetical protein